MDKFQLEAYQKKSNCINYACQSGIHMFKAPDFCLTYFKIPKENPKSEYLKVCLQCYEESLCFYKYLSSTELDGNLMKQEFFVRNNTFKIGDSNFKEGTEKVVAVQMNGKLVKFVMRNVNQLLKNAVENFKKNDIVKNAINFFSNEGKKLTEIDQKLIRFRDALGILQNKVYKNFSCQYEIIWPLDQKEKNTATSKKSTNQIEDHKESFVSKPDIEKPDIQIGGMCYALSESNLSSWVPAKILHTFVTNGLSKSKLVIKRWYYAEIDNSYTKFLTGKKLACLTHPKMQLKVGTRVIAVFEEKLTSEYKENKKELFFPGIVAESLCEANQNRYLIFFDDGNAQYVSHQQVRLVFKSSQNVWEDVCRNSRKFIKKYLESYPDKPSIKFKINQLVLAEYKGLWHLSRICNIDSSLIQICFLLISRSEWIYEGSTRLNLLHKEEKTVRHKRNNKTKVSSLTQEKLNNQSEETDAVKSTTQYSVSSLLQNDAHVTSLTEISKEKKLATSPDAKLIHFSSKSPGTVKVQYEHDTCSPYCKRFLRTTVSYLNGLNLNPLSKPIICGWSRFAKGKKIIYETPCGRPLKNMQEVHSYLRITESEMAVDMFDFDYKIHYLTEFTLEEDSTILQDLSNGLERIPISVVNNIDSDMIDFETYSIERVPMEGVNLNLDPEFLCGCDCEDDCSDKTKCSCWKLTQTEALILDKNISPDKVGYQYRRLLESVRTAIYECNSKCKCSQSCLNRVVQNPMQTKLQVFKTLDRGWGIRCLNDIPKGTFLFLYIGLMLTEEMANELGEKYGDEYLAELNYIEVVEKIKEGYEEKAILEEEDLKNTKISNNEKIEEKKEELVIKSGKKRKQEIDKNENNVKKSKQTKEIEDKEMTLINDDEEYVCEATHFNPSGSPLQSQLESPSKCKSLRQLYDKNENIYIIDGKLKGNIGRFVNHSCNPNLFVQNVFVDTHDVRFPWISFFSLHHIAAGTELTWDYNYVIGSVPGKVIYCHCGSKNCRKRLI